MPYSLLEHGQSTIHLYLLIEWIEFNNNNEIYGGGKREIEKINLKTKWFFKISLQSISSNSHEYPLTQKEELRSTYSSLTVSKQNKVIMIQYGS